MAMAALRRFTSHDCGKADMNSEIADSIEECASREKWPFTEIPFGESVNLATMESEMLTEASDVRRLSLFAGCGTELLNGFGWIGETRGKEVGRCRLEMELVH